MLNLNRNINSTHDFYVDYAVHGHDVIGATEFLDNMFAQEIPGQDTQ